MALPDQLISGQVGVVRRGDEIAGERLVHVLVHCLVSPVEHAAVFGLHISEEAFERHAPAFYS